MTELTFSALRKANVARMPLFKNGKGEIAHSQPDGSDWSPAQWLQAMVGEVGEYANVRKKFERGDINLSEFMEAARNELADVMIYLDLLAFRLGIALDVAVIDKFNKVSKRIGCDVVLPRITLSCSHLELRLQNRGIGGGAVWECPDCGAELIFKDTRSHGR